MHTIAPDFGSCAKVAQGDIKSVWWYISIYLLEHISAIHKNLSVCAYIFLQTQEVRTCIRKQTQNCQSQSTQTLSLFSHLSGVLETTLSRSDGAKYLKILCKSSIAENAWQFSKVYHKRFRLGVSRMIFRKLTFVFPLSQSNIPCLTLNSVYEFKSKKKKNHILIIHGKVDTCSFFWKQWQHLVILIVQGR